MMGTIERDWKWAKMYPELGTEPLSTEPYVSSDYFELEREKIFKHTWLNVGRVEMIPDLGSYIVKDIAVLQASIIVIRGQDNKIRAFHNSCRHRGNKVALNCKGLTKGFSCHFHGWTYDSTGALKNVPDEDQFYKLEKSGYGLKSISLEIWQGFIFINLEDNPKEDLKSYLGEIYDMFEGYFDDKKLALGFEVKVNSNWKLAIDAFSEAYHVCGLHKKSAYAPFASKENPFCHLGGANLFKRHRRVTIPANPNFKGPPSAEIAYKYGGASTYIPEIPEDSQQREQPYYLNPDRIPSWGFDVYIIFPTFLMAVGNGGWTLISVAWPEAVDQSIWKDYLYLPAAKSWGEKIAQELTIAQFADVQLEDLSTLDHTQAALKSGAVSHMLFSDQEFALRHNYKVVADYVGR